ncbi:Orphan nuclear receptor NR2E1, putative [Pediculus humanus corporis]|uniref:Nuclear receptor subfamily 2 group E member 1 n=1 Tax=Pediculus humanus subsp. corporis TaxID=121224 RepID=E0VN83_PEDHC|nr:Orphan nuclear receptor NR2E1, putative [Pediculus humanus corporis]EEB14839.1 Orphan nuclear receptor NR2E1, putative [Pediculus humanus corporis]
MMMTMFTGRILYDIPCKVCQDHSSGKHYGIFACDGCAGFFKRSIRRSRQYLCKAKSEGSCTVDKTHRNQCRACRLKKCVEAGMNKDAVQHERGPRNSTLRRQMAFYFKEPCDTTSDIGCGPSVSPILQHSQTHVLDLALPKIPTSVSPRSESNGSPLMQPTMAAAFLFGQTLIPKLTPNFTLTNAIPLGSVEALCESAARLLFMNVTWAKNVPAFTRLNYKDQLLLLEESWRELFVLSASQFMLPLELVDLLTAHTTVTANSEKALTIAQEVKQFQETLIKFKQLHVDIHEYACLRAIVLFKTSFDPSNNTVTSSTAPSSSGEGKTLHDLAEVAAVQDHTQLTLNKYISAAHPTQPFRFGKLLLLLPSLRSVSNNTIEELFFRRTIGNIPIERIICDMYKASD